MAFSNVPMNRNGFMKILSIADPARAMNSSTFLGSPPTAFKAFVNIALRTPTKSPFNSAIPTSRTILIEYFKKLTANLTAETIVFAMAFTAAINPLAIALMVLFANSMAFLMTLPTALAIFLTTLRAAFANFLSPFTNPFNRDFIHFSPAEMIFFASFFATEMIFLANFLMPLTILLMAFLMPRSNFLKKRLKNPPRFFFFFFFRFCLSIFRWAFFCSDFAFRSALAIFESAFFLSDLSRCFPSFSALLASESFVLFKESISS